MSILIKGMEMPKSCDKCPFCIVNVHDRGNDSFCKLILKEVYPFIGTLPDVCPLIEVPPHGKLIDADALKARVQKLQEWLWDKLTDADVRIVTEDDIRYRIAEESEEFIDDAPTIIESEECQCMTN